MKVRPYQRIERGEHSEVPEEIWKVLKPIEDALENMTQALQGRLDDATNLNAETRELRLEHGVAQQLQLQRVVGKAASVVAMWQDDQTRPVPGVTWTWIDEKTISVTPYWPTDPGSPIVVRLKIRGDQ